SCRRCSRSATALEERHGLPRTRRALGVWGPCRGPQVIGRPLRGPQPARMRGMSDDAYGLPVSTADPEALALYDRAVRSLPAWQADALELFRAAAERDPGLALALAGPRARLLPGARF